MQHPAIARACREKGPGALALACLHDVVIAARIATVSPAAFDALGAGENARGRAAQRNRACQQPEGSELARLRSRLLRGLCRGERQSCDALPPLPLAGEGWGEGGVSEARQRFRCRNFMRHPHPRLRRGLSRRRERRRERRRGFIWWRRISSRDLPI